MRVSNGWMDCPRGGLGASRWGRCWDEGSSQPQAAPGGIPTLLGAPKGFTVTVRNLKISAGAGFIVALTGDIMTMPGLPKVPAAERIDVDENGKISGLF